jgi:WD40 repeat protein
MNDPQDLIHGPPYLPPFVGPPVLPKADPMLTRLAQELKHNRPLLGARFDPAGQFVFAGAEDNTIQRWALADGKKTALAGHQSWIRALAFHQQLLISGDYSGKILCWTLDADTPAPLRTIDAHDGWVRALAVSPDGTLLASCGNDNLVKLWTSADGKPVRQFAGHARHVYNVVFHPDGKQLVSTDLLGVVKHWDMTTGNLVRDLDAGVLHKYDTTFRASIGGARGMTFNRAGSQLALSGIVNVSNAFAGVGNPAVVLFDWGGGKRLQLLTPKEAFQGTMWGVVHHPDGFWIGAGGGSGGALWFWKGDQDKAFHTVKLPSNGRDLALHPHGIRLAVPGADGAVRFYDMAAKA